MLVFFYGERKAGLAREKLWDHGKNPLNSTEIKKKI